MRSKEAVRRLNGRARISYGFVVVLLRFPEDKRSIVDVFLGEAILLRIPHGVRPSILKIVGWTGKKGMKVDCDGGKLFVFCVADILSCLG